MAKSTKIQPIRCMHFGPPPKEMVQEVHQCRVQKTKFNRQILTTKQYPYIASDPNNTTFSRLPYRDWERDWGWNSLFWKKDHGWWGDRAWQGNNCYLVNTNDIVGGSGAWNQWQSGPSDKGTLDSVYQYGGWWTDWGYYDSPLWGTNPTFTGSTVTNWTQSRDTIKMPVFYGNGDDDTKNTYDMEGDEYGCHGISALLIADISDNSGSFANWGFDHAYALYRSDAEESDFQLYETWRADMYYLIKAGYVNPQWEPSGFNNTLQIPNTPSGIRLLQYITCAMRRGQYWKSINPLLTKLKETGKCTPRDIWEWFKPFNFAADPWWGSGYGMDNVTRYYLNKIDKIISFLRSYPKNDIFVEMQQVDKNSEYSPGEYRWDAESTKFYIGDIGFYEAMVVHYMKLRSNGAMFDLDSNGSGGVFGYGRTAQFMNVKPWFGLEADNKYGIVNGQRTMKVLQPWGTGVNPPSKNARNKKYCFADHRAYPFTKLQDNTFEYPNDGTDPVTGKTYRELGNDLAYDERIYKTYVPNGTNGGSEDGYMEVKGYTN